MTAQLSRIVYRIGSPENEQHHFTDQKDHADIAKNNGYEVAEYVLAGMDSDKKLRDFAASQTSLGADIERALAGSLHELYLGDDTAPPAPVALSDELLSAMEEVLHISDRDHDAWNKAKSGILSCRAAILKSGPVTAYTAPDGWKLVPVEPTQEMIWSAKTVLASTVGWDSFKMAYAAMLASAPAAPEPISGTYKVKPVSSNEPLISAAICPVCHGETKSMPFSEIKYCPVCNPDYPQKNSVMNCGGKK